MAQLAQDFVNDLAHWDSGNELSKLETWQVRDVVPNMMVPALLAELNFKTPLGHHVLNRLSALIPARELERSAKSERFELAGKVDVLNAETLPAAGELRCWIDKS